MICLTCGTFAQGHNSLPGVLREGFDGSTDGSWLTRHISCSPGVALVAAPVRTGRKALRVELSRAQGDRPCGRSELSSDRIGTQFGRWYSYGFSVFIPNDWKADDLSMESIAGWHSRPDFVLGETRMGGAPLAIRIDGKEWNIRVRWDSRLITYDGQVEGQSIVWREPYVKGKWTDWVVAVRWSFKNDGRVEIWKDRKKIVDRTGPNAYNDLRGAPYFKFGIYKWAWLKKPYRPSGAIHRLLYFDNVWMASGAAFVQAQGLAP